MSHPPIQMDNHHHHHHHHRQYPPVTPSASGFARQNKPSIAEDDDIMELLWQNGKVVMQSQNHRSLRKPPLTEIPPLLDNFNNHLFMPFDHTFPLDFLYSPPSAPATPRPPIPPSQPNFASFSSHNTRAADLSVMTAARDSTVVDSCHTPAEGFVGAPAPSTTGAGGRTTMMCDLTMTSSPEASSNSDEPVHVAPPDDRKRKGREAHEWECQSEDVDFELEAKKQVGGSTSTKRSRAAEVHNLSERRRRDRINEKMRALQELIPRCNKSDKASMLDEAISYLKSLQLQVQMMSMGCGMMPMMFPGIQQYMPAIGMGVGIGMGMEMGMNRPLMPFPNMLSGSALPAATAAAHLGPRFPMPPFHVPNVPVPHDSSRLQPPNQTDDNMVTSAGPPDPNQSRIPNFTDPYQQYLGSHQMQFQLIPNQAMNQPNVSKPSTSRGLENPENHESG